MLAMWKLGPFHLIVVMGAAIAAVLLLAVATEIPPQMFEPASSADYEAPVMAGKIESPDVTESSGLSASECQDVLWTHNDAGSAPLVFAMDFTGKHLGAWRVEDSRSTDWESIATYKNAEGKCSLLIGDIGDNDKSRQNVEIYRLAEPAVGYEILMPIHHPYADVPLAAKYHHERLDGRGYPDGLYDREIPYIAKIVNLADSFDAMTTDRPYKRRRPAHETIEDLRRNSGLQFAPEITSALFRGLLRETTGESKDKRFRRLLGREYMETENLSPLIRQTLDNIGSTQSIILSA